MNRYLATTITRPLRALMQSAQQIGHGDHFVRAPAKGRDEVSSLAVSFNQMAARLEELEQTRQRQLAAITHELARPLTGMRAAVETLLADDRADEVAHATLMRGVLDKLTRMQRLVEALQTIQKHTLRPMALQRENISLERVIRARAGNYEARAAQVFGFMGTAFVILLPMLGGLLVGPLVHFVAPQAKGHGVPEVMTAMPRAAAGFALSLYLPKR